MIQELGITREDILDKAAEKLTMNYELIGICGCKVSGDAESLHPGEVVLVNSYGSMERRTVFEVATDPAKAGEKEYAIFECLRRSALARCQQHGSSM